MLLNSSPAADNWTGAGGNSEWSNVPTGRRVPSTYSEVIISDATVTLSPSASPDTIYSLSTSSRATLGIVDGGVLTVSTNLDNSGTIYVDGPYGDSGGGILTIDGTLTNSSFVEIGNNGGATGTITAAGLDNTGTIDIAGNGNTSPDLMNIAAAAPETWVGTLNISGDGELEFASGEIATIASGAQINLSGPQAWVADAGAVTGNTALAGLTSIAGQLQVANGALLTTDGALDNSGTIYVDGPYGDSGGGILTIDGTLTNSNFVEIGNNGGATGTITAAGLDNTGTIDIAGNGNTSPDLMNIAAAAPETWVGTLNISGDGELEFASGEIATIASGAQINLSGPQAWVADAGAVTGNTALAGLTSIAGQL